MVSTVAFIPARSGSKRIPHKNIRSLNGHPLLAYSICSAIDSGVFDKVICATDSNEYADIARYYGAEVPALRPEEISHEKSSDINWVKWILDILDANGEKYDVFSLLRPTSPFRKSATIQRAWNQFRNASGADSLRAVELCKQHPGKMWVVKEDKMTPLLPMFQDEQPLHSIQYAALPSIYVQNASLEIAWVQTVHKYHNISGYSISPFLTVENEGLDVNEEFDWWKAERLLAEKKAELPVINNKPWK